MKVYIGTSGWHYPHWCGPFYPDDILTREMLPYYGRHFESVEINNSFYQLPSLTSLVRWRDTTPKEFCFSVKASRYLTHMKKLKDPGIGLSKFLPRVEVLEDKLGPILFQLPPHWHCDLRRLGAFLAVLPRKHRYAFELRDHSWHTPQVYRLLEEHNVAFCIYDLAGFQSPIEITADFSYVRLHGPHEAYQGCYSSTRLKTWAKRIRMWQKGLKGIYVYFDNDQDGYAARNALELKEML